MATAGTHNYRIFMERGLPPVQSITRRWLRGSLLITIASWLRRWGCFCITATRICTAGCSVPCRRGFHRGGAFAGNRYRRQQPGNV